MSSTAEVLATHDRALFESAVARAVAVLRDGGVVGLPTETVYGLAANGLDPVAVRRIFEIKGRPAINPVILHVAGLEMARRYVTDWPGAADRLAAAFWPGPLTLVLPRAPEVPDVVTAGGETVGVRWPSHPIMQAVIRACGFPLAAPSANPSNGVSPTNAGHVLRTLGGKVDLIVDGGQSQVGIESTVLDLTLAGGGDGSGGRVTVLRPGVVHGESILAALGEGGEVVDPASGAGAGILRSPGQMERHYSPRARVLVLSWANEAELEDKIARAGVGGSVHVIAHTCLPSDRRFSGISVIPHDAEAYARALYGELHRCDEEGADLIVVERVPEGVEWAAVADRLRRAMG